MSESRCNYQRISLTNPQKQWFVSSHFASNRSFKSLFFNKPDLVLIKCNLFIYNLHERHSYWLWRLNYLFAFVDQRGLHSHIVFDKILWQTSGLVNFRNSLVRKHKHCWTKWIDLRILSLIYFKKRMFSTARLSSH